MIAFSTDACVAARGIYLLSFLPQPEVDRIVDESVADGRRSFAALIPETAYGNAVEAEFREAVARKGARVAAVERYPSGAPGPAVERLARVITGAGATADTLFIPDTAEALPAVAAALTKAGYKPARVRPVGTALWNEPSLYALPALQGGWFASPDRSGFSSFSGRYQARFGAVPPRVASLAYDAVMLSAALNAAIRIATIRRDDADQRLRLLWNGRHLPVSARGAQRSGAGGLRDPQRRRDRGQPGTARPGQARDLMIEPVRPRVRPPGRSAPARRGAWQRFGRPAGDGAGRRRPACRSGCC